MSVWLSVTPAYIQNSSVWQLFPRSFFLPRHLLHAMLVLFHLHNYCYNTDLGIYNHGILSRIDAELILHSVEYDCFLIRESMRHENDLVYSLKEQGQFLHILLEHKGEGSYGPHGQHEAYPNLEFFIKHVPKVPCFMPFLTEGI